MNDIIETNEILFSIESVSVNANIRTLKVEYSMEPKRDLKSIHSLDADVEAKLSNILSSTIRDDISREMVHAIITTLGQCAVAVNTEKAGIVD